MYKILRNKTRKAGAVFGEMDANFLAVCKAMIKLANADLNLLGYADSSSEPATPSENDCYLVIDAGTYYSEALEAEKYDIIERTDTAWVLSDHKLTELNKMLQENYFDASNISITTPANMTATNLQAALDEIAAVVFPTE